MSSRRIGTSLLLVVLSCGGTRGGEVRK